MLTAGTPSVLPLAGACLWLLRLLLLLGADSWDWNQASMAAAVCEMARSRLILPAGGRVFMGQSKCQCVWRGLAWRGVLFATWFTKLNVTLPKGVFVCVWRGGGMLS